MGAQTTSSTTDGHLTMRAGRGRGVMIAALTAALFSLSAGAAAASPVETPPSPQHLDVVCGQVSGALPALPVAGAPTDQVCQNVNGWQ
jgi:hypothetical protein